MRYMINDAFRVLQIKPTDDKREIKRAYAKLVKQYHPEEHPTEWKNIRDAYETAIAYAERQSYVSANVSYKGQMEGAVLSGWYEESVERMRPEKLTSEDAFPVKQETFEKEENDTHPEVIRKSAFEETEMEPENETDEELEGVFEQLDELSQEQAKQILEVQLKQALQKLEQLAKTKDIGQWETFFYETDLSVLATGTFLYKWGDILSNMKIRKPMCQFANNQLTRIREYCRQNEIIHEKSGLLTPLEYVHTKLRKVKRNQGFSLRLVVFVCAVLFVLCQPEVWKDDKSEVPATLVNEGISAYLQEEAARDTENIAALEGTGYTKEGLIQAIVANQVLMSGVYENREMKTNPYVETIETGIRIKEGIYLSGWEKKLNPVAVLYEEITDAEQIGAIRGESLSGKNFFAMKIRMKTDKAVGAVGFRPQALGLGEDYKVYFSYGGGYVEVCQYYDKLSQAMNDFCYFTIDEYRVFSVLIPWGKENEGVTVVIVENHN